MVEGERDRGGHNAKMLGEMPRQLWRFRPFGDLGVTLVFLLGTVGEIWHLRCGIKSNLVWKGRDWLDAQ